MKYQPRAQLSSTHSSALDFVALHRLYIALNQCRSKSKAILELPSLIGFPRNCPLVHAPAEFDSSTS